MGFFDNLIAKINEKKMEKEFKRMEKYMEFPQYIGEVCIEPEERKTFKYNRLTTYYKGELNEEYINIITEAGFEKATDVRYDKGNLYIIVEKIKDMTKIAYHIKK